MKTTTLRTLAGVTTPLVLAGSVQAGFLGISTVSRPNPYGLLVVNVYAEFDRPGEDLMVSVFSTPKAPMVEVIGGTFYNHQFGSADDFAPGTALVAAFPSLAFDSFVTIGVTQVGPNGQPVDDTYVNDFPGVSGSSIPHGVWGVLPSMPAADPFNPDFVAGDGRVLIGQFSTADGIAFSGTVHIRAVSNDELQVPLVSFFHVPGPGAFWLLGATGLLACRRRR